MQKILTSIAIAASLISTQVVLSQTPAPFTDLPTFEAKLKQAGAHAQILDARSAEEFQLNHLKGAIQLNVGNEDEVVALANKLDKKKPVFIYGINNGRSTTLANKLRELQFSEVLELKGGLSKWIGAGKPVESTVGKGLTFAGYLQKIKSDKLVLVDIHNKYCGSCKKLSPIVDSLASEKPGSIQVVKIDLFDNKELGTPLQINCVPTLLLYKGDKIVWRKDGFAPKAEIQAEIDKAGHL